MTTISEARSAAEAAGIQVGKSVLLYLDSISVRSENRDGGNVKQICDLQDISDRSANGISALKQIQSSCGKTGSDVPGNVLGAQRLMAPWLTATSENSLLSSPITAGSNAFKVE